MSAATAVLVPLAAVLLIFALSRALHLLHGWRAAEAASVVAEDADELALLDEKQRLLTALADLEHEHQMGKVSGIDYTGLRRFYEDEAVRVLKALEQRETA